MWPNTMKRVALRIWEKWEKGKSKNKIVFFSTRDVFCQNINADWHTFFLEAIAFPLF
jgi:hypothetical protein